MAKKRSTATRRADSEAASARAAAIRREQERKERRRRSLVVTLVGLVVLAVIVAIYYGVRTAGTGSGSGSGSATSSTPAGTVSTYAVPAGPASAPVKVSVYEDFMCPFCGQFEKASRAQLQQDIDAGKVQVQYHVLNFLDRSSTTNYSTRAANALGAVLDASGPKVAKRFHDLLFENQPAEGSAGLSDSRLVALAVQAGAPRKAVQDAVSNKSYESWVAKVTDRASKDKVTATPTVRVDGKDVTFTSTPQLVTKLQSLIDQGGS
jgi:protein-disulfide isomerase